MALEDDSILWNKLGSDAEVTNSEIGQNGAWAGAATYSPCKFDDGSYTNSTANYILIPGNGMTPNAFCFDQWIKTDFDVVNGVPQDGSLHSLFEWRLNGTNFINLVWHTNVLRGLYLFQQVGGVWFVVSFTDAALTWLAGTLHHILYIYNQATNEAQLYLDGVFVNTKAPGAGAIGAGAGEFIIGATRHGGGYAYEADSVIDNIKVYNKVDAATIAAIIANRNNEGWPDAPIVPVPFAPIRPRVIVLGNVDLYDKGLIDDIGNVIENRSFRKDKLIDNDIKIPVDNTRLHFSVENSQSIFNGTNWRFSPIRIWDENNIKIWDGLIWDIIRNSKGRKAFIVSRSVLSKIKNIKVAYESSDYETGPEALINIFIQYGITEYDPKTFQDSIDILTDAGALIKFKATFSDGLTLQDCIEKIAEYSGADSYSHLGIIYFKVWRYITGSGAVTIDQSDIWKMPVTESALQEVINDYSIGYSGDEGTPATDADNNNIGSISRSKYGTRALPELSTGDENQIVFKDLTTAVYIGELYIKRTHRNLNTALPLPLYKSKFSVDGRLRNHITLETILNWNWPEEGFNNTPVEVFRFNRNNDKNIVDLTVYGVAS